MTKTKIFPKGVRPIGIDNAPLLGYIEYIPEIFLDPTTTKNLPLVIALHGKGDGGKNPGSTNDLTAYRNKKGHLPNMLETGEIAPECIVIMPQTDNGYLEGNSIVKFRDYIAKVYQTENIGLMGLSAGGASVWKAIEMYPELFKAFVPICGAYEQKQPFSFLIRSNKVIDPPVWAFHGAKDTTVYPHWTIRNCGWLCGDGEAMVWKEGQGSEIPVVKFDLSDIRNITENVIASYHNNTNRWILTTSLTNQNLTIYANEGHGIWGKVYKNEMMWQWLISHLTGEQQPPVEEERLYKDFTDGELALALIEYVDGDLESIPDEKGELLMKEHNHRLKERIKPKL